MKKILLIAFLLNTICYGQIKGDYALGKVTKDELSMTHYDKDPDTGAVILEEKGETEGVEKSLQYVFYKTYYARIKILKKSDVHLANRRLYHDKDLPIKNLKAVSYNLDAQGNIEKTIMPTSQVFRNKVFKNANSTSFAIPNVTVGSVIEFTYTIGSYSYGLYDWEFQSFIPKIRSTYDAYIPDKIDFNTRLIGYLKLKDTTRTRDKCRSIYKNCYKMTHVMDTIPAFKKDVYMTSSSNFMAKLAFERAYYNSIIRKDGNEHWNTINRIVRVAFNKKTRYKKYFKEKLPSSILNDSDALSKAKKIYTFIKNHYTWNKSNYFISNLDLKKAFHERKGSLGEINMALLNALQASGIDAKIVLLSTRDNIKVTDVQPILSDFNYLVIRVSIDDKIYHLDATNKHLEFGQLPFKCLNGSARYFNIPGYSFWEEITPNIPTKTNINTRIVFDKDAQLFKGVSRIQKYGYRALALRDRLDEISEKEYIRNQSLNRSDIEVVNYKIKNLEKVTKPTLEVASFAIELSSLTKHSFSINPYMFDHIVKNPFALKERKFPIDYGNTEKRTNLIQINIPEGYEVRFLPKNVAFSIRDKELFYYFQIVQQGNSIQVKSVFEINTPIFSAANYEALKAFYDKVIESQKDQIIIKKI